MSGKLNSAFETERWAELIILSWEKNQKNQLQHQNQIPAPVWYHLLNQFRYKQM